MGDDGRRVVDEGWWMKDDRPVPVPMYPASGLTMGFITSPIFWTGVVPVVGVAVWDALAPFFPFFAAPPLLFFPPPPDTSSYNAFSFT